MDIIITSPTSKEWSLIKAGLKNIILKDIRLNFHTSGVGIMASTYSLSTLLHQHKPDLILQCGLAGSFSNFDDRGEVYVVEAERTSPGVEEKSGWRDLFDMGFADADEFPFREKKLLNPWVSKLNTKNMTLADGLTVEEISTNIRKIERYKNRYKVDLESMEGASFHYVCLQQHVPFLQVRAISNMTGERDKRKWQVHFALKNLSICVVDLINSYSK